MIPWYPQVERMSLTCTKLRQNSSLAPFGTKQRVRPNMGRRFEKIEVLYDSGAPIEGIPNAANPTQILPPPFYEYTV